MNLLILFVFTFSITSWAENFGGVLTTLDSKIAIKQPTSDKKFLILTANVEIKNQINMLKVNDFVSLEGTLDKTSQSITVQSLNFVGLKELLGNWTGNDNYCYRFKSFSNLTIFNKNQRSKCDYAPSRMTREFSYTINPTTPNWLVLLSDNSDSYIMDLVITSKSQADLSLYDNHTGDIIRQIKLKR